MASNHTANYNLSQWEENDEVLRVDFNADNLKLDTALAAAEAEINALQTALAMAGNCTVMIGTYTGTGQYGSDHPCYLSFPHRPMVVLLGDLYTLINDQRGAEVLRNGDRYSVSVTWGERSVSWYGTYNASKQCNSPGTNRYIAFLDKEN